MATVQELERDIKAEIGNLPNISQIAKYMHKRQEYVRKMMSGIDCLETGRTKQYTAKDVARQIYANMS